VAHDPTWSTSTIVRNTSGVSMYFDFAGPRGATIAAGADVRIPGNVLTMWANNAVKLASLNYALQHNLIEILKTPDVIVYDAGSTAPKVIGSNSGTPNTSDPDYGSYSGSAPNP